MYLVEYGNLPLQKFSYNFNTIELIGRKKKEITSNRIPCELSGMKTELSVLQRKFYKDNRHIYF